MTGSILVRILDTVIVKNGDNLSDGFHREMCLKSSHITYSS